MEIYCLYNLACVCREQKNYEEVYNKLNGYYPELKKIKDIIWSLNLENFFCTLAEACHFLKKPVECLKFAQKSINFQTVKAKINEKSNKTCLI